MSSSSSKSGSGSDLYGGYGGVLGGGYTMSYYYSYDSSASGDGGGAIKVSPCGRGRWFFIFLWVVSWLQRGVCPVMVVAATSDLGATQALVAVLI